MLSPYPHHARERDQWIVAHRATRNTVDVRRPHTFLVEDERAANGEVVPVATIFLTNRECPFRCLMCDLWRNTLTESVPVGAIPAQMDYALSQLPPARQIKLYNSGSFFDPRAIPPEDYDAIADRVRGFERVIVECHPAFVGDACWRFHDLLRARNVRLEVAIGLETAQPDVLAKLNKRMTLDQVTVAAQQLRQNDAALRVFILVKPPFTDENEALHWAKRSLDFAFDCGATAACLIPTRAGNGALDALAQSGEFLPPKLATLEAATEHGIALRRGRVFADLWDLHLFSDCAACFPARLERLRTMNLRQEVLPLIACESCGEKR